MMGERTDTNEMQEVIPGMDDYDDGGSYGPVQNHDGFDPEAFRRKFIAYMTAACVLAIVVAAFILLGAGVIALIGAMF